MKNTLKLIALPFCLIALTWRSAAFAQDENVDLLEKRTWTPQAPAQPGSLWQEQSGFFEAASIFSGAIPTAPGQKQAWKLFYSDPTSAGLGPWLQIDKSGAPRLIASYDYPFEAMTHGGQRISPSAALRNDKDLILDLGRVNLAGAESLELADQQSDWTVNTLSWESGSEAGFLDKAGLKITVSRLTPAVLFEAAWDDLLLFSGRRGTIFCAGPEKNSVRTTTLAGGALGQTATLIPEGRWLLLWFGPGIGLHRVKIPFYATSELGCAFYKDQAQETDYPLLLVFDKPPEEIASIGESGGIRIRFAGQNGKAAMLPLFGENPPPTEQTAKWAHRLPDELVRRCEWWAARMNGYPIGCVESYAYRADIDAAVVTERISYAPLTEQGMLLAPVPPMLALATQQGFPVEFSSNLSDSGLTTKWGPYCGIEDTETYTWQIRNLNRLSARPKYPAPAAAPTKLLPELEEQVVAILDAGHLAPFIAVPSCHQAWGLFYWSMASDVHAFLVRAAPLMPDEIQTRIREYLRAEQAEYPAHRLLYLPPGAGTHRERWRVTEASLQEFAPHLNWDRIPAGNLYGLAEYFRFIGEIPDDETWAQCLAIVMDGARGHDWASLGWFRGRAEPAGMPGAAGMRHPLEHLHGGVMSANSYLAGLTGFLRMARMRKDADAENCAAGLLARAAAMRVAQAGFTKSMYERGVLEAPADPMWMANLMHWIFPTSGVPGTFSWDGPMGDVRQVLAMDQYGVELLECSNYYRYSYLIPFLGMTPELGGILRAYAGPDSEAYLDRIRESMPDWHIAYADAVMGGDKMLYRCPSDAHQLFMAHAWIKGCSGGELESYLDIPWTAVGDFFHLDKLIAAIIALGSPGGKIVFE